MNPIKEYCLDGKLLDIDVLQEIINEEKPISYAKLCDCLGLKRKGGKSKMYQLDRLNKIILLEKVGGKFLIHRFRTEEELEVYGIQGTYTQMIARSLYSYLIDTDKRSVGLTMYEIMGITGLSNINYKRGKYSVQQLIKMIENKALIPIDGEVITEELMNEFFERTFSSFRSRILLTLRRMEESNLIEYSKVHYYSVFTGSYYTSYDFSDIDIENLLETQRTVIKKIMSRRKPNLKIGVSTVIDCSRSVRLEDGETIELTESENYYYFKETRRIMIETNKWKTYSTRYKINVNRIGMKEVYSEQTSKINKQIEKKSIEGLKENIKSSTLESWFLSSDPPIDLNREIRKYDGNIG